MRADRASRTSGTYVLERRLIRRGIGIRACRHAILEVGRVRLRNDVQRARGMFAFVLVRRRVGSGSSGSVAGGRGRLLREEWRVLEGREGGVEGAAERLGERASVLGCCCADGGHVDGRGLA